MNTNLRQHNHSAHFLLAILASALTNGCSSFVGVKISDKSGQTIEAKGIPFALTRSEFFISRTPPAEGEKKPTYAFVVKQELDPAQRYTLKIDPATFANPDFVVKLTTAGTMLSTTSTMTDQIGPTITALGSFAKDIVAVSATGLFDKLSPRSGITATINRLTMKTGSSCALATDAPSIPLPNSTKPLTGKVLVTRIESYVDDDEFAAQFHYVTELEKRCLDEAKKDVDAQWTSIHKPAVEAWPAAKAAYVQSPNADRYLVDQLDRAIADRDKGALEQIIKSTGAIADATEKKGKQDLVNAAGKAANGAVATAGRALLDAVINMSDATWRARQVMYLEREANKLALIRLRTPDLDASDARKKELDGYALQLAKLRTQALGTGALQQRSAMLQTFLQTMPERSVPGGGKAPASAEYATARAELDAVNAAIEARRAKVIADGAPPAPPKIQALRDQPVVRVSDECLKSDSWKDDSKGCLDKDGKPHSYIVVLEEVK